MEHFDDVAISIGTDGNGNVTWHLHATDPAGNIIANGEGATLEEAAAALASDYAA